MSDNIVILKGRKKDILMVKKSAIESGEVTAEQLDNMKSLLKTEETQIDYKPLDLTLVLKTAASIIGVPLKKVKMGRIIGNSEVTSKIELIIEIFVKYCLENNSDNYTHTKIAETFNGYNTKVHVLMHRFREKGISAKSQFYFNELCKQIKSNEKAK